MEKFSLFPSFSPPATSCPQSLNTPNSTSPTHQDGNDLSKPPQKAAFFAQNSHPDTLAEESAPSKNTSPEEPTSATDYSAHRTKAMLNVLYAHQQASERIRGRNFCKKDEKLDAR